MKKFFKRFTSLFMILLFSFLLLPGFTNAPTARPDDFVALSLNISSTGCVTQSLKFSVGSKRLDNLTANEVEKATFIANLATAVNDLRTEFLLSFTVKYIKNPVESYAINRGLVLTNTTFDDGSDTIGFDMIFTSLGAWRYYHGQSADSGSDTQQPDANKFISKTSSESQFPFSGSVQISENETVLVGQRYKDKYLSAASGLSFEGSLAEQYNPTFVYDYSTPFSRLRSDAQEKFKDGSGNTHHVWTVDDEKLSSDNSISLYQYKINTGWWYLTALVTVAAITGVAIATHALLQRRKKRPDSANQNVKG